MAQRDLTGLGEINALLGKGTEYEGKLTFEGRVRIDGRFRGQIFSPDVLILGDGAEVDAEVDVGTLIVRGGTLRGQVKASQLVELHAPAKMEGDVLTPQIFVDKGVVFEGKCIMPDGAESEMLPLEPRDSTRPAEAHGAPESAPSEAAAETDGAPAKAAASTEGAAEPTPRGTA